MRALVFLGLTGCLSGVQAAGQGDLLITEFGNFSPAFSDTTYVEISNPGTETVNLSDYTLGVQDGFDFTPSEPLSGTMAPGSVFVIELGGGDLQSLFGSAPDQQARTVDEFAFRPDSVTLYLADGSGFEGAAESANDATVQDTLIGDETENGSLNALHVCRREGVPRGRGRFDRTEWIETETFGFDDAESTALGTPGSAACP